MNNLTNPLKAKIFTIRPKVTNALRRNTTSNVAIAAKADAATALMGLIKKRGKSERNNCEL